MEVQNVRLVEIKKDWQAQQKQGEKTSPSQKLSKDQLIEQAMQNARVAREAIGQETLDRIAAAMQKKQQQQNSPMEQAKKMPKPTRRSLHYLRWYQSYRSNPFSWWQRCERYASGEQKVIRTDFSRGLSDLSGLSFVARWRAASAKK